MIIPVTFHLSKEEAKRVERVNLQTQLEAMIEVANRHKDTDPQAAIVATELEKFKDVLIALWKAAHFKIFEIKLSPGNY